MKKQYPIKVDKKLIVKLQPFWKKLQQLEDAYDQQVLNLEKEMEQSTKIEGIEFFMSDGYFCGIGNADKTMRLIHDEELDKCKH